MTTKRKFTLFAIGVVLVAIQWFGPVQTNPPIIQSHTIQSRLQIPARVADILNRSCMDCHSYETHWPVCGQIAPVSWWLVDNVNRGRAELNFSEWAKYRPAYVIATLGAMGEAVGVSTMPPDSYLEFHPRGKLSNDERQIFHDWAVSERHRLQVELLDTGKTQKVAVQ
ncbi:MAG TPA: heme-binding domain-containing protein [Verrucomicrobiae bacterium]|jgi:hypothetical protein